MSRPAPLAATPPRPDRLGLARRILRVEADALSSMADSLDPSFDAVAGYLEACRGRVAVSGVGKSADVGQKLVGTFNSTGTRAYLLDPTRAVHGDLGMVHPDDVALVLSHSGDGDELGKLLGPLKAASASLVAITGRAAGTLARIADAAIIYGPVVEACPLQLAPSTSTTLMLALGDALAFTLLDARGFTAQDFARVHPAGTLGRKLAGVEAFMRRGAELRLAPASETVRQVFAQVRHTGRRTGAVMLTAADGTLAGLFTDSDLARLLESHRDGALDEPIAGVMTADPLTVSRTAKLGEALELMQGRKISELPVLDEDSRPVGLLDITDLLGLPPDVPPPASTLKVVPGPG